MLTDLNNVVVYGFAAFSATVGYAFSRAIRPLPSRARAPSANLQTSVVDSLTESDTKDEEDEPNDDDESTDPGSLKRKRAPDQDDLSAPKKTNIGQDLSYPLNLYSLYPNNRRESLSDRDTESAVESVVRIFRKHSLSPSLTTQEHITQDPAEHVESKPEPLTHHVENDPVQLQHDAEDTAAQKDTVDNPKPAIPEENPRSTTPESTPSEPVVPRFTFPQTTPSPRFMPFPTTRSSTSSTAFSTFSGSSNPFFTSAGASPSGFNLIPSPDRKPIWASTQSKSTAADHADPTPALAIAAATPNALLPSVSQPPVTTGEEDESALLSLRGLTLFVKRGDAAFSSGVAGTLKLLSHKTSGAKRLLFRREPLWQVAMNVRMHGALRCTFDEREGVLRVILKELRDLDGSPTTPQTVIYAFKPGRTCRRPEFGAFAEALVVQARQGGQDPLTSVQKEQQPLAS
ncbi:hypothetical protein C8F01DRAFT_741437 [Mycena amicta]|nr:hypothetical protein C8F01DRAFT_741437 [Mycena amicta]